MHRFVHELPAAKMLFETLAGEKALEYTFVDKLQTICRRFRQHRDRRDALKDRPWEFLRHYYDLYMLLDIERVIDFLGKAEYKAYKKDKLSGADAKEFATLTPFTISDRNTHGLLEREYAPKF